MGPAALGKAPKRYRGIKPPKQKTYKSKTYRTDRLRRYLSYEPHKNRLRKSRKVFNLPKGALDYTAFKGLFRWKRFRGRM